MSGKTGIPVIVTGFGPFGDHKVNVSWEIAKTLPSFNFGAHGIQLIIEEIPVAYSVVNDVVPQLWKKHSPRLVIHLGLTGTGSEISLETIAHKTGYRKKDIFGELPENGSANGKYDLLETTLNAGYIAEILGNSPLIDVPIQVSTNAGRYLCEFTYYTSLNIDPTRAIFVHVPNTDKGYSILQMAYAIRTIILMLFEEEILKV